MKKKITAIMLATVLVSCLIIGTVGAADKPILKIGYSDWPGWVAWEIGVQKGWFKEAGVDARFFWYDYVGSIDAFAEGKMDAVCITNIDALVTGASGRHGKAIVINDYSNGSDMLVARAGIESVKDLKGKTVALEVGLLEQLLLRKALEKNGLTEADVTVVNLPTDKLPLALKVKKADAVVAWQPSSGEALNASPGAKAIFTSADVPGLIYDTLFVADESLKAHPEEWKKVAQVWFRIVDFIKDSANKAEVLKIMGKRVGVSPGEYEPMLKGAFLLDLEGNRKAFAKAEGLDSIYGSTKIADLFNVDTNNYKSQQDVDSYLDPKI
jgi:NitT/TauT family transport system substrate-binding protein